MSRTDRERFINCVLGQPVDRVPYLLFWGPWGSTWKRWEEEGLPELGGSLHDYFGASGQPFKVPVNCGPCPKIEQKILEDDGEYVIRTDGWGITRRNPKANESMSEFLQFPVGNRADWERFKAKYLTPDDPRRLEGDWREACRKAEQRGAPIQLGYFPDVGIFGTLRWLLGDEECLLAFYDAPDLVHEIMEHMTDVYLWVFEQVAQEVRVNIIHIWEDMCGRQGPLISPAHWIEFLGPCYRRIKTFAEKHNIPILSVDTDGRPHDIIPAMLDAGVNLLYPMEVAAGCDINEMQQLFPTLGMLGGVDKRVLARSPEAIDAELERLRPAIERGRYIPTLDHCVPSDVSWQHYAYYAERLKELIG